MKYFELRIINNYSCKNNFGQTCRLTQNVSESFPTPPTQPPHAALRPYQDTFSSPLKLLQLSLELRYC